MKIEINYFLVKKGIDQYIEEIFSFKIQLTPIHSMSRLISMSQAVACDSQAVAGASKLLKIGCRRTLVKYLLYWIVMNYFHNMVDNIHQKRIWRPYLFTSATSHLKFARARVERHVIGAQGNSCLNKGQTFIKQAIPSKNIPTCWSTDIL